ncbi:MAG: hypothetical protein AB1480_02010 [Nitrospirota bacterium]
MAYIAKAKEGDKWLVVVDGKEGKKYDGIGALIFSPDSKRVAYQAIEGDEWFVVVDGKEGKRYDMIVTSGWGRARVIFDSPDNIHYLARKGSSIYLVEERIR